MNLMNIVNTMSALACITMILIGSSWLKAYLKRMLF